MSAKSHKFTVKHAKNAKWKQGLREDFEYRDLGIKEATRGQFGAHIIRIADPEADHHTGRHAHMTAFQMVYVLQGEARFWIEGKGEISVKKGSCFYQPDGLVHDALWMSPDCELLEIISPAEFETVGGGA
jgi:mannose-6-phosphate isomerase-like protein (cupin superfamily)